MKFLDHGFKKLNHKQNRQTDATERITTAAIRAGNGSMGHGSWVKWVTKIGWVTWVMGH